MLGEGISQHLCPVCLKREFVLQIPRPKRRKGPSAEKVGVIVSCTFPFPRGQLESSLQWMTPGETRTILGGWKLSVLPSNARKGRLEELVTRCYPRHKVVLELDKGKTVRSWFAAPPWSDANLWNSCMICSSKRKIWVKWLHSYIVFWATKDWLTSDPWSRDFKSTGTKCETSARWRCEISQDVAWVPGKWHVLCSHFQYATVCCTACHTTCHIYNESWATLWLKLSLDLSNQPTGISWHPPAIRTIMIKHWRHQHGTKERLCPMAGDSAIGLGLRALRTTETNRGYSNCQQTCEDLRS